MDIVNNYEIINYEEGDYDKYLNKDECDPYETDCTVYYMNGLKHRDDDEPAVIYSDGSYFYYKFGELYRNKDAQGNKLPIGYDAAEEEYVYGD